MITFANTNIARFLYSVSETSWSIHQPCALVQFNKLVLGVGEKY